MQVKPGYKRTDVGVIPDEWKCAPIASVARLESGHTPSKRKPSYWGGSVQWVSLHDTAGLDGRDIAATAKTITQDGLKHSSARLLPPGTVVFSRTATVGKSTVMATSMSTSQDFANYICGPDLHNHFLVYLFRGMGRTWQRLMAGSIHNTIYMPVFKALMIALPPLPEQRAIAAALSDVDALLGGLDRLITKKRDLKEAAMQQLLNGQTRLPGFSGKWTMSTLGEHAAFRTGPFGSALHKSDYTTDGVPIVNPMHIFDGHIRPSRTMTITEEAAEKLAEFRLKAGEIVMGRRGDMGRCAVVRDYQSGWLCGTGSMIIRARGVHAEFLRRVLSSPRAIGQIEEASVGTTMVNLNQKTLAGLAWYFPLIAEQTAIADVLCDMDAELGALEARRDKTRALKQGMMQELLTGRTRLI